jgi:hypothetical protein
MSIDRGLPSKQEIFELPLQLSLGVEDEARLIAWFNALCLPRILRQRRHRAMIAVTTAAAPAPSTVNENETIYSDQILVATPLGMGLLHTIRGLSFRCPYLNQIHKFICRTNMLVILLMLILMNE